MTEWLASLTAQKNYKVRPLELLRVHHEKIEAWILEQAGIVFDAKASVSILRLAAATVQPRRGMPRLGERFVQLSKPFNSFPASIGQDSCRRAVKIVDIDQTRAYKSSTCADVGQKVVLK